MLHGVPLVPATAEYRAKAISILPVGPSQASMSGLRGRRTCSKETAEERFADVGVRSLHLVASSKYLTRFPKVS